MENQTAAPRSRKRRRSRAPDGQQAEETGRVSPPPATDAPGPELAGSEGGRSGGQEPPVGAGGGEGEDGGAVDYIGALPDAVLEDIVSLLPTKDGARTRTLARRWRHIWRSAPLNLNCLELPEDPITLVGVVSGILSAHQGPARRFCVDTRLFHFFAETVDAWLQSPALNKLQELAMSDYRNHIVLLARPSLPAPMFRFSSCLRVATLGYCSIPDGVVQTLQFPKLQKLALESMSISAGALQDLIARCPILECLLIDRSFPSHCVRINSASLRRFGVCTGYHLDIPTEKVEIIIEDAPSLERLVFLEEHTHLRVSIISAPKLHTLGGLIDWDISFNMVFGSTVIQGGLHVVERSVQCSIKVLAVSLYNLSLDVVIDLMMCFPNLETLYVESSRSGDKNLWRRKYRNLIKSIDIRLKTVVFLNYRSIKSQANFLTFFILNAKLLETMRFVGRRCMDNQDYIARQHRLLQLDKRASIGAKFHFMTGSCDHYLTHVKHVHDLSVTDPFECTCREIVPPH